MITASILWLAASLFQLVVSLIPVGDPPAWWGDLAGYLGTIWGYCDQLGAWIPWSLAGTVVGAILDCLLVAMGIRVVRILLSLFTGGGGAQ
jgi:hypothetical protein